MRGRASSVLFLALACGGKGPPAEGPDGSSAGSTGSTDSTDSTDGSTGDWTATGGPSEGTSGATTDTAEPPPDCESLESEADCLAEPETTGGYCSWVDPIHVLDGDSPSCQLNDTIARCMTRLVGGPTGGPEPPPGCGDSGLEPVSYRLVGEDVWLVPGTFWLSLPQGLRRCYWDASTGELDDGPLACDCACELDLLDRTWLECEVLGQDCPEGQKCSGWSERPEDPLRASCVREPDQPAGPGEPCALAERPEDACGKGLQCVAADHVPGCTGDGCCSPFCDPAAEDTCATRIAGTTCVPWTELTGQEGDVSVCGA